MWWTALCLAKGVVLVDVVPFGQGLCVWIRIGSAPKETRIIQPYLRGRTLEGEQRLISKVVSGDVKEDRRCKAERYYTLGHTRPGLNNHNARLAPVLHDRRMAKRAGRPHKHDQH